MASPGSAIFVFCCLSLLSCLFFPVGASSRGNIDQHAETPSAAASIGSPEIKFPAPSLTAQLRKVPPSGPNEQAPCSVNELRLDSYMVRTDFMVAEVTNNCERCLAYNIVVDCSPVKTPMGKKCAQPPNYSIAFKEKWRFWYVGKSTPLPILSADFKDCD